MTRKPARTRLRDYVFAALLTLVIIWLISLIWGIARKEEIARSTVGETRAELALLEERRQTLDANLTELSTDRGQEASLRQSFGVARPGEDVIIVVPREEPLAPPERLWWQKALDLIGF